MEGLKTWPQVRRGIEIIFQLSLLALLALCAKKSLFRCGKIVHQPAINYFPDKMIKGDFQAAIRNSFTDLAADSQRYKIIF